jgi:hypothetical protein
MSTLLLSLTTAIAPALSEGAVHEPAVNPYVVGLGTFALLVLLLVGLLMFGAGRDHS